MKTTNTTTQMPNNILLISEKLMRTKAPWKINNSYMGQLTKDHKVIIFDYDWSEINHQKAAKKISPYLYDICQNNYNKLSFAGIGKDTKILAELAKLGFVFDAAIMINNEHGPDLFVHTLPHTAIYHFYNKKELANNTPYGAECGEFVKTIVPAHMSNKIARQAAACMIYQSYEQTYLSPIAPMFINISH